MRSPHANGAKAAQLCIGANWGSIAVSSRAAFKRLPRCGRVARGQVHVGRRRVDDSCVGLKEVGCALEGDFDRRSSGVDVSLVGKRHRLKRR